MVVRKSTGKQGSRVKVGKLKLSKETVKNLPKTEAKKIRGGTGPGYKHLTGVKL